MIHENIELTGSFSVTGSLTLPNYPSSASHPTPITGSMYNDTGLNAVRFYDGVQWQTLVSGSAAAEAPAASGADIEYLLVAGGGGGGGTIAGGGGAGGLLSSSLSSIESGSSITVTVGAGGTGGYGWGTNTPSTQGANSSIESATGTSFTTVTSTGGGKGGNHDGNTNSANRAGDGGSGGGTGREASYPSSGGSGTTGQGNDGGSVANSSTADDQGSGGGGAGAQGDAAGADPDGGIGKQSSITGTSTYYAGGGGGGVRASNQSDFGEGGSGGGGNGSTAQSGVSGTANTGGGGGGGGYTASTSAKSGGDGGSGVAIFAYPSSSLSAKGGSTKTSRSDGYVVHTFNSSGTLTVGGADDFPVINNEVFSPVLYTGNGGTQSISAGFTPDLVWIKNRTVNQGHSLWDTVRGASSGYLQSQLTNTEATQLNMLTFDSDGFNVSTNGGGYTQTNRNSSSDTYVAWCWKAGGTAVSNTDGSITSQVSANTAAGFSVVKYTGTGGSAGQTESIGHGLSTAPELIIVKNTDSAYNWVVRVEGITSNSQILQLNLTAGVGTPSQVPWGTPTSSTFLVGRSNLNVNENNSEMVAYCFHSVDGYQKVGSYTGTGTTSSFTGFGFQPRWILLKRTDSTGDWWIFDNLRGNNKGIRANLNGAEDTTDADANTNEYRINFLSDGFQYEIDDSTNASPALNALNGTYIYLAIA